MSLMQRLNIISHNLLWSRYKFLFILIFYISYIYINNSNNIALCEENQTPINNSNSINTNNKLIGSALFIGSIIIILFLKSLSSTDSGSDIDVSSIIDPIINQGANIVTQSVLSADSPELLDTFTLNSNGDVMLEDVNIIGDNVYLNAQVVKEHFLHVKAKSGTIRSILEPIKDWYIANLDTRLVPIEPKAFIAEHIAVLNNLQHTANKSELYNVQNIYLINALVQAKVIPADVLPFYDAFLQNGNSPVDFYSYYLQNYRVYVQTI